MSGAHTHSDGGADGGRAVARRRPGLDPVALRQLQRTVGNRAVTRLVDPTTTPGASHPGDPHPAGAPERGGATSPVQGPAATSRWVWLGPGTRLAAPRRWVNRVLDRLPRTTVTLGVGRLRSVQPSFRVAAWSALVVAATTGALLAPSVGITSVAFLQVGAMIVGTVVAVLLVHRLIAYTLQLTVLAAASVAVVVLRLPLLPVLDVVATSLVVGQAFGRVGCAMVGCCHGRPARWGQRYGPSHARVAVPARLVGVRLLPVQLLETLGCLAVTAAALTQVGRGAPAGTALGTVVVCYAALRFGLERLRGDSERRWAGGLSEAQWTAALLSMSVLMAQRAGMMPETTLHRVFALGVLVAGGWSAWHWHRRQGRAPSERLGEVAVWDDLARCLDTLACLPDPPGAGPGAQGNRVGEPAPLLRATNLGVSLSLTRTSTPDGLLFSYGWSSPTGGLGASGARRVADLILRLRHPDAGGLLLPGDAGCDLLLVPPTPPRTDTANDREDEL